MDTTLKDMHLSLQSSLMSDLSQLITKFSSDIHNLGVSLIEDNMEECTMTVNDLDEAKESWIRAKLAELEDRSRRNNVKLRRMRAWPAEVMAVYGESSRETRQHLLPSSFFGSLCSANPDKHHEASNSSHLGSSSQGDSCRSSPGASPLSSPQKIAQKRSSTHRYAGELGNHDLSQDSTMEFVEHINEFHPTGQPLSDTIMREMLVTLRGSLHREIMNCISQVNHQP